MTATRTDAESSVVPPPGPFVPGTYRLLRLGEVPYPSALALQRRLLEERRNGTGPDSLLLLTHPPTLTQGRSGKREHLLWPVENLEKTGVAFHETDRGGDITFHGPGQLVGYPILDLLDLGLGPRRYIRTLEAVLVETLGEWGLEAHTEEGLTGVWVGREKVAAIGVRISRWVTMHGFALNVSTNLDYFDLIIPCGIEGRGVTSLSCLLAREVTVEEVEDRFLPHFERLFKLERGETWSNR